MMKSPSTLESSHSFGSLLEASSEGGAAPRTRGSKTASAKIVLISNEVMHYRVSVYNYFQKRLRESGYELVVLTNRLQPENQKNLAFELLELPFSFAKYRQALRRLRPAAVILFLHLKDKMIWPLIHWMKLARIPFAFWTKGGNWDEKESRLRYEMFNYVHGMSDGLILYSDDCRKFIRSRYHAKAFVANNTVNFEDYPEIPQSKAEIKREFGISFERTVIFIGRMSAGKGRKRVHHLIEIFRDIDRDDIGLVLVGSGLSEGLRQRMNPRNTVYLGEVHDPENVQISKLCKMADVCAIPGHVGLGLNQAFYWGLPVVTEEDNHPPEICYLRPGRNGFIVPRNDLNALRGKILTLLDNDELRAEFSRCARHDILREGSIEGMFAGFKACIDYISADSAQRVLSPIAN